MAIVTKNGAATASSDISAAKVAAQQRRVVIWAIALRSAEKQWSAYAIRPNATGGQVQSPAAKRFSVPIPDGAQRILSIRRGQEPGVSAFYGPAAANAQSWQQFFDRWAADAEYRADADWTVQGETQNKRFRRQVGDKTEQVDIQFGPDGQGGLRGSITESTGAAAGGKSP